MKKVGSLALLVFCLGVSAPLFAQELKGKVVGVLQANKRGDCPESLMAPTLRSICEDQLPNIKKRLDALGDIDRAEYKGIEKLPNGLDAEVYKVIFDNGSMIWLATAGPDGKLNFMWSPG
jgi:hypothetical protein